jgi:hypothetical protein
MFRQLWLIRNLLPATFKKVWTFRSLLFSCWSATDMRALYLVRKQFTFFKILIFLIFRIYNLNLCENPQFTHQPYMFRPWSQSYDFWINSYNASVVVG